MLKKIIPSLLRATMATLVALLIWAAPHLKDGYTRQVSGSQVVRIVGKQGVGSGFHIKAKSNKTYILTNAHVCGVADEHGILTVQNSKTSIPRRIVAVYKEHDLCLIEPLPQMVGEGLSIASSLLVGEDLVVVGHPAGRPLTLSKGEFILKRIIKLVDRDAKSAEECEGEWREGIGFFIPSMCIVDFSANGISAPIYPGNSGSPVLNKWGNVVGVVFAGNTTQVHDAYMVPIQELKKFLKDY
jgi:S1-C subfamily serine protease